MSEALHRMAGIDRLPIFPLPLVLLPNEIVPLHIFEERYRQMLKDVEEGRRLFGVSLFEPPHELVDRPETGTVGCVAEVREAETLPDGRSNIVTVGVVRYRVLDYLETSDPYLVARVEFFEDAADDAAVLEPLTDAVFAMFERMAQAAFKLGGSRSQPPELKRSDPESLSFLITAAFNFENEKKYSLLETTSTIDRLQQLKTILTPTLRQLEESAAIQTVSRSNGHSKKEIDL